MRNLGAAGHDFTHQSVDGEILRRPFIPVVKADEGSGGVRLLAACQKAVADDIHGRRYAGLFFEPVTHVFTDFLRFRLRNAFRKGDIHHDEGTVFSRYEARRHDPEDAEGSRTDDDQEDDAPAQVELQVSQDLAIACDEAVEPFIEFIEEFVNPLGIFFGLMDIQDGRAHGRRQGQGDEGRNEDRDGNGQGELAVEDTAHAA